MVNWQNNQEIELHTTLGRKNKRKSKFTGKTEGNFFAFLPYFQRRRRKFFSLFKELIFEQRK